MLPRSVLPGRLIAGSTDGFPVGFDDLSAALACYSAGPKVFKYAWIS
jgi:hypothetical protein